MLYTAARYIPSLVNKYNSFKKYETHLTSFAFVQAKKKNMNEARRYEAM